MTQRLDPTKQGSELVQRFFQAQDLPKAQRRALVERVSRMDREMGLRLAALLAADEDQTDPRFAALRDWLAQDPIVVGEIVGEYRITECLSQGGMAAVYAAAHRDDPTCRVVFKILHQFLLYDRDHAHSLLTEASTARLIEHPGVIEILASGYLDTGQAYIMMPFLAGESLGQRIRIEGPLPVHETLAIMDEVLDIVIAMHERDIVHRDLKPENIMLVSGEHGGAERVVLLDFGIALHASSVSSCHDCAARELASDDASRRSSPMVSCAHSSPLGTPLYMAPEQFVCPGSVDPGADLYALGCILYTMLDGRPPFTGSIADVQHGHLYETPPGLASLGERLPGHLQALPALMRSLLSKDPAARPTSAARVRDALASMVSGERAVERLHPRALSPVITGSNLV